MAKIDLQTVQNLLHSDTLKRIPTQQKLSLPILQRLCAKMVEGVAFEAIHVKDNRIVDGHHRYVSAALAGKKIGATDWKIAQSAVDYDWSDVTVEEIDWDTTAEKVHFKATDVKEN